MMKLVKHWNVLLKEAADIPFLKTFQSRLNRTLNNLIQLKMSLIIAQGLD